MTKRIHHSEYFYGNQISAYGIKNKRLDYRTLAKAFPHILNNDLMQETGNAGFEWEIVNGDFIYYEDPDGNYISESDAYDRNDFDELGEYQTEIFQWYIVPGYGAEIIQEFTNDVVMYNDILDVYLWGISHFGTSWDYVLTDVKLQLDKEA